MTVAGTATGTSTNSDGRFAITVNDDQNIALTFSSIGFQSKTVAVNNQRVELAFEGLYYSDIRRWKTAEIVNNGPIYNYAGKAITNRTFDKTRDYLWPIPFVQIQENPQLQQNPNYR